MASDWLDLLSLPVLAERRMNWDLEGLGFVAEVLPCGGRVFGGNLGEN